MARVSKSNVEHLLCLSQPEAQSLSRADGAAVVYDPPALDRIYSHHHDDHDLQHTSTQKSIHMPTLNSSNTTFPLVLLLLTDRILAWRARLDDLLRREDETFLVRWVVFELDLPGGALWVAHVTSASANSLRASFV